MQGNLEARAPSTQVEHGDRNPPMAVTEFTRHLPGHASPPSDARLLFTRT